MWERRVRGDRREIKRAKRMNGINSIREWEIRAPLESTRDPGGEALSVFIESDFIQNVQTLGKGNWKPQVKGRGY